MRFEFVFLGGVLGVNFEFMCFLGGGVLEFGIKWWKDLIKGFLYLEFDFGYLYVGFLVCVFKDVGEIFGGIDKLFICEF